MPFDQLDRCRLRLYSLRERENRVLIERDRVLPGTPAGPLPPQAREAIAIAAAAVRRARAEGRPAILAFGAHAVKNGLAPVLIGLLEQGWLTHLATNGAGIIHDWELAFQGATSENVRENVARGRFGLWIETGRTLSLALAVGAYEGLGYGEAVGCLVAHDGLRIPAREELLECIGRAEADPEGAAAAADLLGVAQAGNLPPGFLRIEHPYKSFGLQAAAYRLQIPYTGHPMFGHDIIYTHPLNRGAAVGRTAERDFLGFAHAVSELEGGVYLSVGSAIMSPMIFEKSLSMARNLAHQDGRRIEDFDLVVVDLAPMGWDWQGDGEPPPDHPAYYVRFCKTFSRMGGRFRYIQADNRDFLLALSEELGAELGTGQPAGA
jgi:hypothetical protein